MQIYCCIIAKHLELLYTNGGNFVSSYEKYTTKIDRAITKLEESLAGLE